MISFSGINTRSIAETEKLSFSFNFYCDSNSGIAALGFSGEDKSSAFRLESGRLLDPEDRYVYSFAEKSTHVLSGQFSGSNYDYYIDQEPVCFVGKKESYKTQKFFVNTTGCNIVGEVSLCAPSFEYEFDVPEKIFLGDPITGKLTSSDLDRKFRIFSGQVISPTGVRLSGFDSGDLTSSDFTLSVTDEAAQFQKYNIVCDFNTSFGDVKREFGVLIIPEYDYGSVLSLTNVTTANNILSGGASPFSAEISGSGYVQTGDWFLNYATYATKDLSEYQTYRDLDIRFDYLTGNTGEYYIVTGYNVVSGGSGYNYPLNLSLSQDSGGYASVTGKGFPRLAFAVTGLNLAISGSGYTGIPDITISGGGGGSGVYAEAVTGFSGVITGVSLISGGSGFFTNPTITLNNLGTGAGTIAGSVTASIGSGYLDSCFSMEFGAYYKQEPTAAISGGSGSGAHVVPLTSGYTKSFTSFFSLQTGVLTTGTVDTGRMIDYGENNYLSLNTGFYNSEITYVPYGESVGIRILKNNYNDLDQMVGRVTISGMQESYTFYDVTGYRSRRN